MRSLQGSKQKLSPRQQRQQQQREQTDEAEPDEYGQADGYDEDALSQSANAYSEQVCPAPPICKLLSEAESWAVQELA